MRGIRLRDVAPRLLRRPSDLWVVGRAGWLLRARGWWHRPPFLPLPDPSYWAFRVTTATGSKDGAMNVDEMVHAARWSLRQRAGE